MKFFRTAYLFIFWIAISSGVTAQNKNLFPKGEEGYEALYLRNIKKSRINGVYIPANLEEAFLELDDLSPEGAKAKFTNAPEDVIATKLHFGLGRWIFVYWNFIEGSRYVEYLRRLGLRDHDHMIQFTIVSYHRYKNNKPLDVEGQVAKYKKLIEEKKREMLGRGEVIHTETRPIKKGN
ncbi:MAG: hypothetical protein P1U56_14385 [Saprospiraceae bacterium]|nr:hypothetical protein [Saprospiraceae bacterium]